MKLFLGLVFTILTAFLVYKLDQPMGALPAIGGLLDPVNGCWANAEPVDQNFTQSFKFPSVKSAASVWFDKRMVPHIRAGNDHDVYFLEGYIHAKFRLWQMDMETRAAGGRVSEVAGAKALDYDRKQRRKGMVYAAENSLAAMEKDTRAKGMVDAYTEGINAYIATLSFKDYPLEYKLMGFAPEKWTNIKSALLLKYMADDLTGETNDIPLTYLREILTPEIFNLLYPVTIAGSTPVIPSGTKFEAPSLKQPIPPTDNVFPVFTRKDFKELKEDGIGSNNWALSGKKTKSGAAILCNDPHLGLHLPCLWFEAQLQTPDMNVYGVTLPGAPGVIIGFTDSVAWGFTNNYRDVKDYYLIKRVEKDNDHYWFEGEKKTFGTRVETIVVKGAKLFVDTVKYTIHGPLMYDEKYAADGGLDKPLAMCWMGHKATNELLAVYLMNRAKGYESFVDGMLHFECPAQNMIYADRAGNIALWGQGQFINKWKGQGRFVMDGSKKDALWGDLIPLRENPHAFNPEQGYLASANESVTDSTYPYWYNGNFIELRSWRLNEALRNMQGATVQDMFALQNDTWSFLASKTLPVMLKHMPVAQAGNHADFIEKLQKWDYKLAPMAVEGSIYQVWWYYLYNRIWAGFHNIPGPLYPLPERTMQLMLEQEAGTVKIKELQDMDDLVQKSFKLACDSLERARKNGLLWYQVKKTGITHLTKLPAFSLPDVKIGGWGNVLNAANGDHGPSWRMVVEMGKEIEAYGVYPGGQSGNPGSKFYADFVPNWTRGKYYRILFLPNAPTQKTDDIAHTWTIQP